jgi:hypothetical protein
VLVVERPQAHPNSDTWVGQTARAEFEYALENSKSIFELSTNVEDATLENNTRSLADSGSAEYRQSDLAKESDHIGWL